MSKKLQALLGTSEALEREGSVLEIGEAPDAVKFWVRSQQSPRAEKEAHRQSKKHRHIYAAGQSLKPDQIKDNEVDLCANALVSGWEGIDDDEGKPMEFSADNVRALVTRFPHLRRMILSFSTELENYRETAALEKNSPRLSTQT